jgi:hypothetical protein
VADDRGFGERVRWAKREAKLRFCSWLKSAAGLDADPDTLFDTHIKRIHEYKRQLLNALHIVMLYNRLRENPKLAIPRRTFLFCKAAPAHHFAKPLSSSSIIGPPSSATCAEAPHSDLHSRQVRSPRLILERVRSRFRGGVRGQRHRT